MENNKKNKFGLSDSLIDAVRQVVEKKLDPVDSKELKGKHKDRDDKDIDNDGDTDNSDKFLHKKRKAISKAIAKDDEDDNDDVDEGAISTAKSPEEKRRARELRSRIGQHHTDTAKGQRAQTVGTSWKDTRNKERAKLGLPPIHEDEVKAEASTQKEGGMKRVATGGGMKTFKPKPTKTEGKKEEIDVKPKMEASELPKK
jgi:hypothetical protein